MKKLFVLIAAACMTCTAAFAQTVKPFKEGERAVFLTVHWKSVLNSLIPIWNVIYTIQKTLRAGLRNGQMIYLIFIDL